MAVGGVVARGGGRQAFRSLARRGSGAVVAQFVNAGQSLVFQALAASLLGASGFGTFALFVALLVTINSLQTGWVGDALSVLDRSRPEIRGAILATHGAFLGVGVLLAAAMALAYGTGLRTALAFSALVVVWTTVELGRRLLMARLAFWRLVVSDCMSTVVALVNVAVMAAAPGRLTLSGMLWALTLGMAVQLAALPLLLPRGELAFGAPTLAALREVAGFGMWRSAQAGLRPLVLLLVRVTIAGVASRAVLGQVEAARLLLAPALTLVNGAGSFLLPLFSQRQRPGHRLPGVRPITVALTAVVASSCAILLALSGPLGGLLADDVRPSRTALVAWALFATAFAAGLPAGTALVARRRSRLVFLVRLADSAIGLLLGCALVLVDRAQLAPAGVAVGMTAGAVAMLVLEGRVSAVGDAPLRPGAPRPRRRGGRLLQPPRPPMGWLGRWWVALVGVACIAASDYKLRLREVGSTLSGRPDLNIILELAVYGTVAVFLVLRVGLLRARPPADRLIVAFLGFAGVTAVSGLYATYPALGLVRAAQTVVVAALAVAVCTTGTREHLVRFAQLFTVMTAGSVLFGLVVRFPRRNLQTDRFNWLYVHPVIVGTFLGVAVVVLVALLADRRLRDSGLRLPTWAWGGLLVLNLAGLVATKTRGAAAGALVGCLVVLLVQAGRRRLLDVAAAVLAAVTVAGLTLGSQFVNFAARGQTVETLGTLNSRTHLWDLALDAFRLRPLHGYGLGASRGLFYDETGLGGGHNALVGVLVDAGAIGLVAFVTLVVTYGIRAARLRGPSGRTTRPLLLGFLAFSVVNGATTEGLSAPANVSAVWLFLAASWVVVSTREDRRPAPEPARPIPAPRAVVGAGARS